MGRGVLIVGVCVAAAGLVAGCSAKLRSVSSTEPLTATRGRVVRLGACTTAVAREAELAHVQTAMVPLGGAPFGVVTTNDGRWSFVSRSEIRRASRAGPQVAVMSDRGFAPTLVRAISLPGRSAAGETLTHDGQHLLVSAGSGAVVVSVARAEHGDAHPVLGVLSVPGPAGKVPVSAIEVVTSPDDKFAFVADEYANEIAVFDLRAALADGFRSSGYVGAIKLGQAVVGMAVSPDGRWLFATSELAAGSNPRNRNGYGTLGAIDLHRAETTPTRAVVATAPAGCSPVRVAVSPDGKTVWVTARQSNMLLAFSAAKLVTAPRKALIAAVRVGEEPVGLILIDHGRRMVVTDSNRSDVPGATSGLSVLDTSAALAGKAAILGVVAAGKFPREFSLEPNGRTLLVTNFASGQLEAVNTTDLP